MTATRDTRPAAYLIIAAGCLAAFAAALVPFYNAGYKVDALALAAVLTPFVAYGMFSETLRGPWLLASGLVLLAVCLAVVGDERYLHYDGYHDAFVYWVPSLAAAIVLAIACAFGSKPPYT